MDDPLISSLVQATLKQALDFAQRPDNRVAVAQLGFDRTSKRGPLSFVMHDYWPADDRALAIGQMVTAEMQIGATAANAGARYGVLWAHVVTTRAEIRSFSDVETLSWRRVQDAPHLDPREIEALFGFVFDIDSGFEINVVPLEVCAAGHRHPQERRRYNADAVIEPLPGFTLMRTIAENAPVKEYQ